MSDSGEAEADASSNAKLAETKSESKKKLIRLLTVMAYVSSVSMAAVMLSMYYIFLWEPKVPEHHLRAPLALRQDARYEPGEVHAEEYPVPQDPESKRLWFWPPPRPQPPESLSLVVEGKGSSLRTARTPSQNPPRSSTPQQSPVRTATSVPPEQTPSARALESTTPPLPAEVSSPDPVIQWLSSAGVNSTFSAWTPDELAASTEVF